jgi:hypothetical protein
MKQRKYFFGPAERREPNTGASPERNYDLPRQNLELDAWEGEGEHTSGRAAFSRKQMTYTSHKISF